MRRLIARVAADSDRGVSAILVALCAVILFGIAAWVIDGSAIYQERRELQNGADSAALAVAMDCALGDCGPYNATAESYIDANADDGDSGLQSGGVSFPSANSVRVAVETVDAGEDLDGDSGTVDYVFAGVLGKTGLQVLADATAAWGVAGGGATIPLIVSLCEWEWGTDGGIHYASEPFDPADEVTIFFHESGNGNGDGSGDDDVPTGPAVECDAHPGMDYDGDTVLPGGFGWLQSEDCATEVSPDLWVGTKTGAGAPGDCDPNELIDSTVMIPVFSDVAEAGNPSGCTYGPGGKCYRVLGFAAFHITGFQFPGPPDWRTNPPCDPPDNCISGYFIEFVFGHATGGGGTDLGAKAVWLVS